MTNTSQSKVVCPACAINSQAREWKIFAFLVSALAVALAIEVLWLRY